MTEGGKTPSLTERFVTGEFHFGLWGFAARGIGFVNSFLVISALPLLEYGVLQLFFSTYAIFAELMSWGGLGVGTDILRFVGRGDEARAKRLFLEYNTLRLVTGILLWAIFFFGAPVFAARFGPDLVLPIRIMSFLFFAELFQAMVTTLVSMRMDFRALASRRAVGKSFQLIILIGFIAFSEVGLTEALLAFVIGHVLATSILIPAALRAWAPWQRIQGTRGSILMLGIARAHGKWASVKNIFSQFAMRLQPWLINFFVSTEAVGVYGVATSLAEVVMQTVPRGTMNTLISRIFYDAERSKRVFVYAIKYLTLWGLGGMLVSLLFIPFAIHIFLPEYSASLPFFYILLIAVPLKSSQWMIDLFLNIFRKQKFAFLRMLTRNAASLLLLLVFLPLAGLWAVPVIDVLMRLSIVYVTYHYLLKMRPEFRVTPELLFSFGAHDRKIVAQIWMHVRALLMRRSVSS